jgi:drug/metabolite transporter (DMT)-like permease
VTVAPARTGHAIVPGILWMLATGLCFVAVNALVRLLGEAVPAVQAAFLRFAFGVVVMLPVLRRVIADGLPAGSLRLFAGRGAVHVVAVTLWFFAMARLPVAEAIAIGYLTPVIVTIAAPLAFAEPLRSRRLLAILAAGAGALVALRPGLREVSPAHLAQIGAAFAFAASYLFAKRLGERCRPAAVVAMLSLTVTLGLLPFALRVCVPVGGRELGLLALVALLATAAHYAMMRAFAAAPLAVTQPVVFVQLVWGTLVGALMFGDAVDPFVLLGGGLIVAAVSWLAWREAAERRRDAPVEADL